MSQKEQYKNYILHEVLDHIDGIGARAMFGGFGIYRYGIFFALIAHSSLYFKVNDVSREEYVRLGAKPFTWRTSRGKVVTMGYYELPEKIMDDKDLLREWVDTSYQIAISAKKAKGSH